MADDQPETQWDGFSIYAEVSRDIHMAVADAVDSYSQLAAMHSESAKIEKGEAAEHKANILRAANRLLTELKQEQHREPLEKILVAWAGESDDPHDDGRIDDLLAAEVWREMPESLHELVNEIHEAAWRLGYLKAGRETEADPHGDPESSGLGMIEDALETGAIS